MFSDLDICRSADVLIKQHGEDAGILHAATKADKLLAAGDFEGAAMWKRIVHVIDELQSVIPAEGAILN